MRLKENYTLRQLGDEYIITPKQVGHVDFNRLMMLNESGAYLWREVEGRDFDTNDLARLLTEAYNIDEKTACTDA